MTPEERCIAIAALAAGPHVNHDEIIIAVAVELRLESHMVETVLQRLRMRQTVNCVSTMSEGGAASVKYEPGIDWREED